MAKIMVQGTTYQISTSGSSPADFVAIGGVDSVSGIGVTRNLIDVTDHSSTFEENLRGLPRGGEFTLEGSYIQDDVGQLEIQEALNTDTASQTRQFKVTLPVLGSGDVGTMTVLVIGWEVIPGGNDGKVNFSATFKIASYPVWA